MTPKAFKTRLTALIGPKNYSKANLYYMQVFAAAYKAGELTDLEAILDLLEEATKAHSTPIRYPESYFIHFIDRDEIHNDYE